MVGLLPSVLCASSLSACMWWWAKRQKWSHWRDQPFSCSHSRAERSSCRKARGGQSICISAVTGLMCYAWHHAQGCKYVAQNSMSLLAQTWRKTYLVCPGWCLITEYSELERTHGKPMGATKLLHALCSQCWNQVLCIFLDKITPGIWESLLHPPIQAVLFPLKKPKGPVLTPDMTCTAQVLHPPHHSSVGCWGESKAFLPSSPPLCK